MLEDMRRTAAGGPRGIGTGVGFDWALSVQFVAMAVATVVGVRPGGQSAVALLLYLIGALPPFALGEGLRRGRRWAWAVRIVANGLLTLGGLLSIPPTLAALGKGDGWPLIPTLVLVILSPLIVWRLSQPAPRRGSRAATAPRRCDATAAPGSPRSSRRAWSAVSSSRSRPSTDREPARRPPIRRHRAVGARSGVLRSDAPGGAPNQTALGPWFALRLQSPASTAALRASASCQPCLAASP